MPAGENVTTKFKVDISDLKSNITQANKLIKLANAEFKAASAGMDDWGKSATGIQAKLKQLASVLDAQKSKLSSYEQQLDRQKEAYDENGRRADQLKSKLQELANNGVKKTSDEYKKYETELANVEKEQNANKTAIDNLKVTILNQQAAVKTTEAEIRKYDSALVDLGNESKNADKNTDDLNESLEEIDDSAQKASDGFTVMKGAIANVIGNAIVSGLKKIGETLVDIGKNALDNYKNFEQLEGGIQKLFGKSSEEVIKNANNAYKTAGMDANTYLETVTGFSASLISSLGGDTQKAAALSDQAIKDMSDNANTFGTDIDSIQAAYQGFAKGNFTMLDNLKLGYGGTKEEMLRLVKEAGVVDQSVKSIDDVSFDKIIEGITKTQERMGIAGATAKEAGTTIEGSINAAKGAWQNLLTGIADEDADVGALMKNFVDSLLTAAQNIMPRIMTILNGIGDLLKTFIIDFLPIAIQYISNALPEIITTIVDLLINSAPILLQGAIQLLMALISAIDEIQAILIPQIPSIVQTIVNTLLENLPVLIDGALQLFLGLVESLTLVIPEIIKVAPQIIATVLEAIGEPLLNLFSGLWEEIKNIFAPIVSWFGNIFSNAWKAITDKFKSWGAFWSNLWNIVKNKFSTIGSNVGEAISSTVKSGINRLIGWFERTINKIIEKINIAIDMINKVPGLNIRYVDYVNFRRMETGGVIKKPTTVLAGENGPEAIIPLKNNREWIRSVAAELGNILGFGSGGIVNNSVSNTATTNFTQNIYAPQAPSRLELYRQTKNLLSLAKSVKGA